MKFTESISDGTSSDGAVYVCMYVCNVCVCVCRTSTTKCIISCVVALENMELGVLLM